MQNRRKLLAALFALDLLVVLGVVGFVLTRESALEPDASPAPAGALAPSPSASARAAQLAPSPVAPSPAAAASAPPASAPAGGPPGLGAPDVQDAAGTLDLKLRLDLALEHQVAYGGEQGAGSSEETGFLPTARGSERVVRGLAPGRLWVALLGVDAAGEWRAGSAEGTLSAAGPEEWQVQTYPLREVQVRVRLSGKGTRAKVQVRSVPDPASRFARFSTLRWATASLADMMAEEFEEPLPQGGTPTDPAGLLSLRLPPGRWALSALGPAGSARGEGELLVPAAPGPALELGLELSAGRSCEFSLGEVVGGCELSLSAPQGAWLEALGARRWRVGGLRSGDRVQVYALRREGEHEEAPILGAALELGPAEEGTLVFQPCGRIRGQLGRARGEPGEVTLSARDAGCAQAGRFALAWSLDEEAEAGPRWLSELAGGQMVVLSDFPRAPGRASSCLVDRAQRFELLGLFPGPAELRLEGSDGLAETRRVEVLPGQALELTWDE